MKEDQGLAPVPPLVPEINDRFYKHEIRYNNLRKKKKT